MESLLARARRIVVKIGSSLLTNDGQGLDRARIADWTRQIATLKSDGREVLLVSSGAIAEGMQRLGWIRRPHQVHELQAAAAVGQMGLAQVYESSLGAHGIGSAQILLTHDDLSDRTRYLNARSTLFTLLSLGIVPVINENDTVVTDEIKFGDNDTLGALVTNLVEADALVILTDQAGLYDADPRRNPGARLVGIGRAGDPELELMAGGSGGPLGSGGMLTKILAAKRAATSGASTIIVSGREVDVLIRLSNGATLGTTLYADVPTLSARKQWMADHLKLAGRLVLDTGASDALAKGGKSLLPIGVIEVRGEFGRGDVVSCVTATGVEIARGMVNYSSVEARRIQRRPSSEIEAVLGYVSEPELIHRDNLVVLDLGSPPHQ